MSENPTVKALQNYPPVNVEWLDLVEEDILEPELPIIDPHHHLWDWPGHRYLLSEALADFGSGHNIVATMFAQCHSMYRTDGSEAMRTVGEIEFANGIAAQSASGIYGATRVAAGIIGGAELSLGENIAPVLEAQQAAGGGRFKGVRPTVVWHETLAPAGQPHALLTAQAAKAIACIQKAQLTLDLFVFFTQLDDVIQLCRAFPDLVVVVNHAGGALGIGPYADDQAGMIQVWRQKITDLACCPNVRMKIGGLAHPRYPGFNFHKSATPPTSDLMAQKWKPFVEACVESFSPGRCMFESNFPVDKATCSYRNLWNAYKKLAAPYSADEKNSLFHETAMNVYRLKF